MFAIMIILRLLNNFSSTFFFNNNISYAWEEYEKIVVDISIYFSILSSRLDNVYFIFFLIFKKLLIWSIVYNNAMYISN